MRKIFFEKKISRKAAFMLALSIIIYDTFAQAPINAEKKLSLNGYVKNLQNWQFAEGNPVYANHLLHQRMNLRWYPNEHFSIGGEWRSRMITGDEMKLFEQYAALLKNPNDWMDLSVNWINRRDLILLTNTERGWISYQDKQWYVRLGRQRINWSTTTTWNPNDLFNTYNFLDFDYEERPGCDAFQARYQNSLSSNIEFSMAFAGKKGNTIGGIKYFKQIQQWDLQAIAGWYDKRLTLGGAFAGSIRNACLKGEAQYFFRDTGHVFNFSGEVDQVLSNDWYVKAGILYNSEGNTNPIRDRSKTEIAMSPLQQMPAAFTLEFSIEKGITDLADFNLMILLSPAAEMHFLSPSIRFNLADNLEADIVTQHFILKENSWGIIRHDGFLRIKWSF